MATFANFTDTETPTPFPHTPGATVIRHAIRAAGTATQPTRLVIAETTDVDRAMADEVWLSMDAEHTAEVRP